MTSRGLGRLALVAGLLLSAASEGAQTPATAADGRPPGAGKAIPAGPPALPDVRLTDSRGHRFRTRTLRGGPVALAFLHTRCALPESCPRLARQLSETQELIGLPTELQGRARILTVTLDPAYDTAPRLAKYGRECGADPALWILATGDSASLAALRAAAGVKTRGSGPRMAHGEGVLVYAADGRFFRRMDGTKWTPRDLARVMEEAAKEK